MKRLEGAVKKGLVAKSHGNPRGGRSMGEGEDDAESVVRNELKDRRGTKAETSGSKGVDGW
jgi:hypothetical protein